MLCVGAGFYPARCAALPVIPCRAAPVCAAADMHRTSQNCHCEPVRTPVWQSVLSHELHPHKRNTDSHVAALLGMTFFENMVSIVGRGRAANDIPRPCRTGETDSHVAALLGMPFL